MSLATIKVPEIDLATLEREFRELAVKWHDETKFLSVSADRVLHPAYQRIIGMGRPAIPLILLELQERLEHWFWALHWSFTLPRNYRRSQSRVMQNW